ncbi:MAG: ABC transporter ATP-binding protein [Lachnospiraceae bacterium]|jgi:ATP-binding cassette subfamily B multidrug efflux pump
MIRQLLACLGEYKKYAVLTPVIMVGEVLMEVLIPMVMALIIDNGIRGDSGVNYTIAMGILMIGMALLSLCFGALGGMMAARAGMGLAKNVRKKMFDKIQDFSFSNIDRFSTASLITRMTTDVTNIQMAFMMVLRMGVRSPFMLIGAVIMAVILNARLSLVFLFVIPILAVALYFIVSRAYPRFGEMLRRYDAMNASVQENLTNIRVVKAFVREDYENEKFQESADTVRKAQVFAEKLIILGQPVMQFAMFSTIVAVLWIGGNMVVGGEFEVGQLSSFISYITQILMSLMMLSMIFIVTVVSWASLKRITEVLNEMPDISEEDANPTLCVQDGSIEFRNVSFSYDEKAETPILDAVNLTIRSGETIGVIGGTGSAKSSLMQLIPRLYDVQKGEVLVGGHNVKEYTLEHLRNEVAMVLQKNVLFSGTIKENLLWGNEHATMQEIEDACRSAEAHDFIMSFPKGYETDLGQGGVNVSGGQKQRLCIARALLKRPKIMILDDSTSAVDTATDAKIRQAFRENLSETTTIIVAQRISSVQDADRILVLDEGRVDAIGTHEELLAKNAIYQEVYESQQKGV